MYLVRVIAVGLVLVPVSLRRRKNSVLNALTIFMACMK